MINPVGLQPPNLAATGMQVPTAKAGEFLPNLSSPDTKTAARLAPNQGTNSPKWNGRADESQIAAMEARTKFIQEQQEAWIGYLKAEIAARNDQPYAQVTQNGEVVATFYNSGAMSGMTGINPDHPEDLAGPALAQWRAEMFVKTQGGEIVTSSTAQSQAAWQNAQASFEKPMGFHAWLAAAGLSLHAPSRSVVDFRA